VKYLLLAIHLIILFCPADFLSRLPIKGKTVVPFLNHRENVTLNIQYQLYKL